MEVPGRLSRCLLQTVKQLLFTFQRDVRVLLMHIKSTVQNLAVIIDRSDSDFLAGLRVYSCSLRRVLNLKHVRQHTESEEIIHGHLVSVFHLFDLIDQLCR